MNLEKIKELTMQIKELEKELELERNLALETFRSMSEEDIALTEYKIMGDGISIQYFPKSTTSRVDTKKMKADGIYAEYLITSAKADYVRVSVL